MVCFNFELSWTKIVRFTQLQNTPASTLRTALSLPPNIIILIIIIIIIVNYYYYEKRECLDEPFVTFTVDQLNFLSPLRNSSRLLVLGFTQLFLFIYIKSH